MPAGFLLMYTDRVLPTVVEKRAELESVLKPRFRAVMEADPFTPEQVAAHLRDDEERQAFLFAKRVLGSAEERAKFPAHRRTAMQAMVTAIESNPARRAEFQRLKNLSERIDRHERARDYLSPKGVGGMDDARLGEFLAMKQAQAFRQHDPVQALTAAQVGPDCPHPKHYVVFFPGLEFATADAFCKPQDGNPKTALARGYRFRYDLLPQEAKDAIEADLVPHLEWNPAYMEVKRG